MLRVLALFFTASLASAAEPLTVVCMDPLSKPLSCDCVQGYAQREYTLLGEHLSRELGREVKVVWYESLVEAMRETGGKADLVVGKHSVVEADAGRVERSFSPLASLSGKDGSTLQHGVVVVRSDDAAKTLSDLKGYRIFFGPTDAAEKSSAPEEALTAAGVTLEPKRERYNACSEAAIALKELDADIAAAAVISSYAEPLLEGCGSVKKGDLRVVGKSKSVPFITAFVSDDLPEDLKSKMRDALMKTAEEPDFMVGMETLGFVPYEKPLDEAPAADQSATTAKKKPRAAG